MLLLFVSAFSAELEKDMNRSPSSIL